jgi:ATP phosphoribosyltransferase regulatory subunit HisZ
MSGADVARAERILATRGHDQLARLEPEASLPLREVIDLARTLYGGDWLEPNLALLPALPYYTGLVFEAHRPGVGFAIAAGGRYDGLLAAYGARRSAVGFAIDVPRLHAALFAAGWRPPDAGVLVVLANGEPARTARAVARLRAAGLAVAVGPVAESAGVTTLEVADVEDEQVRCADGRTVRIDELARGAR